MRMRRNGRRQHMSSSRTVRRTSNIDEWQVVARTDKAPGIRLILKDDHLSFTEIAKCVGERWQTLPPEEKEPFESQATAAKEKYNTEMVRYKITERYKEYVRYLADFKLKNPGPQAGEIIPMTPRKMTLRMQFRACY